jgi:hypothetical protein
MPFVLIKGTFHVEGYSPDGDSVRFEGDNKEHWAKLSGRPVVLNAKDHAQLRFEAIDTLETHYLNMHQPLELATGALESLLEGFLEAKDEEIIVIPTVHPTHFDTVVEVEGNTVRLTEAPENLICEGSAMPGSPVPGVSAGVQAGRQRASNAGLVAAPWLTDPGEP